MDALLETLASFVPDLILRRFAADPRPFTGPERMRLPAAVLFADVSGFTSLADRLTYSGPQGVEVLSRTLNDYFGRIIDLVYAHGGDVVKFAGDALVAIWPVDEFAAVRGGLTAQAAAALQCATEVRSALLAFEATDRMPLSFKLTLSAGEVTVTCLGGELQRWEFAVTGAPLEELGLADGLAGPNEIVLAPGMLDLMRDRAEIAPLENGFALLRGWEPLGHVALRDRPALSPAIEDGLLALIPGAIRSRLAAGQREWLAELRRVSLIFVHLPDLDSSVSLDQAQRAVRVLQERLYAFEGSFNKIMIDDKGTILVAAMGLPPVVHENDEQRAVLAAEAMRAALAELGWRTAVGVASGRVFCGSIGNARRREYTMIGQGAVVAARLMQLAGRPENQRQGRNLLCDAETVEAAQTEIEFEHLAFEWVKGRADPVPVFRPVGRKHFAGNLTSGDVSPPRLFGRSAEQARLVDQLRMLQDDGVGGVTLIVGEAGIGKSTLVSDMLHTAAGMGVPRFCGSGDAIEKSAPYHAWRGIFHQVLELDRDLGTMGWEELREKVTAKLEALFAEDALEWRRYDPLLNSLFGGGWPDNDFSASLTAEMRAESTIAFLIEILVRRFPAGSRSSRILIVLDDAHWLDSASWSLARRVSQGLRTLRIVIVMRPVIAALPDEGTRMVEDPGVEHFLLGPLAPEDVIRLVCERMQIESVPEPVRALLIEKAEGHPFYSEELVFALRDAGLIRIEQGTCEITLEAGDLSRIEFPDTLESVITSRIDSLNAFQQLTLKVASVIGRMFAYRVLSDIYPVESDRPELLQQLDHLARLEITPRVYSEQDRTYMFKHILTQEVAYNLMLFSQRRQLHREIVSWYERNDPDLILQHSSLLAYHAVRAGEPDVALRYLLLAGDQALENHANREAADFYQDAFRIVEEESLQVDRVDLAGWRRKDGQAQLGLGNLTGARRSFEGGLKHLGYPIPKTRSGLAARVVSQLYFQLLHRVLDRRVRRSPTARISEAARLYDRLAEVHFFDTDALPIMNVTLSAVNFAELVGPSVELARGYLNLSYALHVSGLRLLSDRYDQRAERVLGSIHHLPTEMHARIIRCLKTIGAGGWDGSTASLIGVRAYAREYGDLKKLAESVIMLEQLHYYRGDFHRSLEYALELDRLSARTGNALYEAWCQSARAENFLRLGRQDEALDSALRAYELYQSNRDVISETTTCGLLAQIHLALGEPDAASSWAKETQRRLDQTGAATSFYFLDAHAGVASAALEWARRGKEGALADLRRSAGGFRRFARIFPVAAPRALLFQGCHDEMIGRLEAARELYRRSAVLAEGLQMPYDAGLALRAWGGAHPPGSPPRQTHLMAARRTFETIGAIAELEATDQMLAAG